jgi:hypothetical protein
MLLFAAIFQLSDAAQVGILRDPWLQNHPHADADSSDGVLWFCPAHRLPAGSGTGMDAVAAIVTDGIARILDRLILGLTIAGGLLLAYLQRISSIRSEWQSNPVK